MELLTASSLTVRHGFPLRTGGVSKPPYESLNSSLVVGDEPAAVHENLARLGRAAGASDGRIVAVTQVHGVAVVEARVATAETQADAVWTDVPGTSVGVRTADCLPILIEDPRGRVAAVHAGWRGVIGEIVARTVELFVARGADVRTLKVGIGPCIQRCCFEVDGDLPQRFAAAFGDDVVVPQAGKDRPHLDLPRAVLKTLERVGVPTDHVAVLPQCTMCDARFFSHRRDRGVTGRHLSFITCQGASNL